MQLALDQNIIKWVKGAIIYLLPLLLASCTETDEAQDKSEDGFINFSISTRSVDDPNAVQGEDTFTSLAIYIYHNNNNIPERAILIPTVPSNKQTQWDQVIEVKKGTKRVFIVSNYTTPNTLTSGGVSVTLSPITTRATLENLNVSNAIGGFNSNNLLKVAGTTVDVTTSGTLNLPMQLRRLQARVELYVYKGSSLNTQQVQLISAKILNATTNSEVKFDYDPSLATMPSPLTRTDYLSTPIAKFLNTFPGISNISSTESILSGYSYQNIVTTTNPMPSTAPSMELIVRYGGVNYLYTGYIGDDSQASYKYNFLQNKLYRVCAVIQDVSTLVMYVSALPWDIHTTNINRPITSSDCKLKAWNGSWGGTNAKTIHTTTDNLTDATFSFELNAPEGASWVATLTNGLDFAFVNSTSGISTTAVSRGVARAGAPYLLAVRATKPWSGQIRQTDLYVTVNGVEIPINPTVGGSRPYPGSSDNRVLIKQVLSTNN